MPPLAVPVFPGVVPVPFPEPGFPGVTGVPGLFVSTAKTIVDADGPSLTSPPLAPLISAVTWSQTFRT